MVDEPGGEETDSSRLKAKLKRCGRCRRVIDEEFKGLVECETCGRAHHLFCWRKSGRCAVCSGIHTVLPGQKQEGVLFDLPAPPRPKWLDKFALILLLPMIGGVGPMFIGMIVYEMAKKALPIPAEVAMVMATGAATLPLVIGLVLVGHRYLQYRPVRVDEDGFLFNRTPKWEGERMTWRALSSFRQTRSGVMLVLRGKPWTRWLGPILHCDGRTLHEIVVALEERGITRFDG